MDTEVCIYCGEQPSFDGVSCRWADCEREAAQDRRLFQEAEDKGTAVIGPDGSTYFPSY